MSTAFERRVKRLRGHVSKNSGNPIDDSVREKDIIDAIAFDDIAKPRIIELLTEKGIEHNPKDKKEILFDLLMEGE